MNTSEKLQTRCAIVGGGPAGMMAGYLLARAGVPVVVLEKHADFNRDFRGDTIHPSTLELMHELGLLDEFLKQPHQEVRELRGVVNGQTVPIADFRQLPTRCKFIAFMPQWDFLNFLSSHAKRFPSFQLHMETEVVDLLIENERVIGLRAKTPRGELEVCADLVIGADGRHSTTQMRAGLEQREFGVPIDVLWMRISKKQEDPEQSFGFFQNGKLLVLLGRNFKMTLSVLPDFCVTEWPSWTTGRKSNCSQCRSIVCVIGVAKDCFAWAILRTPCHRRAALGLILPFRMRSRRRTCWPKNCEAVRFPWTICERCRRVANGQHA